MNKKQTKSKWFLIVILIIAFIFLLFPCFKSLKTHNKTQNTTSIHSTSDRNWSNIFIPAKYFCSTYKDSQESLASEGNFWCRTLDDEKYVDPATNQEYTPIIIDGIEKKPITFGKYNNWLFWSND